MSLSTASSLVLTIPPPLTEHPASVYLSSLSPGSEPTMKRSLSLIAELLTNGQADYLTLDWASLRYKHTAAIRAALIKNYEPATVNRVLCALRRVLKEALRLELMSPVDYARAVDISSVKARKELRGRALTQNEIDALMRVCFSDRTPAGFRDAALIAILRGAGLRRAEVVKLDLKDFKSDGEIKVRSGKGRVDRTVYLSPGAIALVNDWIEIRTLIPGALLCQVNKSGRVVQQRLTPQAVLFILQKRGLEAGLEHFSPHDMRRTFVSDLLTAGTDIATVQSLAGHSNPAITARYDRRGEERKRRAAVQLEILGR
ncbi:tyrosine-type recombinase/integrase [Nostoc sp. CHAB 5715]|uniref:tyrosine-type recombinase/integrase n=1 Tax=Nostoc sp. CHAB 5715 TaxID=2780400 RepID=UPI001E4E1AEB|nr:tyrosine-type recombinase/integrase [Nostoc sp. CHAB 5715]MCC5623528.1 site-specific integrase [Nostoc sp. CHAB 5715]